MVLYYRALVWTCVPVLPARQKYRGIGFPCVVEFVVERYHSFSAAVGPDASCTASHCCHGLIVEQKFDDAAANKFKCEGYWGRGCRSQTFRAQNREQEHMEDSHTQVDHSVTNQHLNIGR